MADHVARDELARVQDRIEGLYDSFNDPATPEGRQAEIRREIKWLEDGDPESSAPFVNLL